MKKKVALITDSSSGYKTHDKPDLYVIPLIVNINVKKEDKNNLTSVKDVHEIDQKRVLELIEDPKITVSTSQPNIGEMYQLVEQLLEEYEEIYVVPVTSTVSGSINSWRLVAEDYSQVKVINQHIGGPMMKWIVDDVYELTHSAKNYDFEYIQNHVNELKNKIYGMLFVSDLKQLSKSGRVSKLATSVIDFFHRRVLISLDEKGMKFYGFCKSFSQGINKVIEYIKTKNEKFNDNLIESIMFIPTYQTNDPENVKGTIELLKQSFKGYKKPYLMEQMPPALTAHPGNNSLVVMFKTK